MPSKKAMTKTTNRKQAEMNTEQQDVPEANIPLDSRLLEILVCPLTRGPLTYDRTSNELISPKAGLAYPIRNGIPIMLADEARSLES
jgi:uncharacterized protein